MATNTLVSELVNNTPILQNIILSAAGDDGKLNTKEEVSIFLKTCNEQKTELEKENIVVTDLGNSMFTIEKTIKDTGKATINFNLNKNLLEEIVEAGFIKNILTYTNNKMNIKGFWKSGYLGEITKDLDTQEIKAADFGGIKKFFSNLSAMIYEIFTNDSEDAKECDI